MMRALILASAFFASVQTFMVFTAFAANPYDAIAVDSRIKTFMYSKNEVYSLKFYIDYQSIIEFAPDENIEIITLGNAYPWKITPINGQIFIKPVELAPPTNMTVITNKRTYIFEISSSIASNEATNDITYMLRFYYPEQVLDKLDIAGKGGINKDSYERDGAAGKAGSMKAITNQKKTQSSGGSINVMYSFTGEANKSTPIEVFDDKKQTYFKFALERRDFENLRIYSVDNKNARQRLQYKHTGDFVVIDKVYAKFIIEYNKYRTEVYNDVLAL